MNPLRAALTGATGFLGLHVLPALVQAGFEVRILARRDPAPGEPAAAAWDGLTFETVRGSLNDAGALKALVQDVDVVVHAAGLVKARSQAEFLQVNRDGTAALAGAMLAQAPGANFLLISSLAAREPGLSDYAFSKRQAEMAAEAIFAGREGQLAIIRPPAIYGPWDRATLAFFQATLLPIAPVLGRGRVAVIHACDAALAIAALAKGWRPGRFVLADERPEGYRMRDVVLAAARATGGRPHVVQLPDALVLAAGQASALWARITGKVQIFGPGKAREMVHTDWTVPGTELLPAEVFTPRVSLEAGFANTVAWYRRAGWL